MLFGGETLRDFAFALLIGIASGTYSSIFIATPVLQHWKEREPGFRARRARILERLGSVPPYATAEQGGPIDVQPKERGAPARRSRPRPARRSRRPSSRRWCATSASRRPTAQRDSRQPAATGGQRASRRRTPRPRPGRGRSGSPPPGATSTASGNGENGDAKDRKPRNRRHGRPR